MTLVKEEEPVSQDRQILGMTRELCDRLRLEQHKPELLSWITWLYTYRQKILMPSDQCAFHEGQMALQSEMKGRLNTEEWKPLIASSLIYEYSPVIPRKLYAARALRIIPAFTLALVPPFIFRTSLPPFLMTSWIWIIYFFAVMFVYSIFFWDISALRKKLYLKADRYTARVFGSEIVLQSLKKIDAMRLVDVEARKTEKLGWTLNRTPYPSITQRIENLEKTRYTSGSVC